VSGEGDWPERLKIWDSYEVFDIIGVDVHDLFPIGASFPQIDVFAVHKRPAGEGNHVLWLAAGEVVEDYPSFLEFYLAMLNYMREGIQRFEDGVWS
jgi:hypothetical protein